MNRRTLFSRLGTIAAGLAAFAALPVGKAEAIGTVPKTHAHYDGDGCPPDPMLAPASSDGRLVAYVDDPIRVRVASDPGWRGYVREAPAPRADLWFTPSAIEHGDGPTGWTTLPDGTRRYVVDGVEVDGPLVWEYQQAECEAMGCSLDSHAWITKPGTVTYEHGIGGDWQYMRKEPSEAEDLARVDAWRRSLHEGEAD